MASKAGSRCSSPGGDHETSTSTSGQKETGFLDFSKTELKPKEISESSGMRCITIRDYLIPRRLATAGAFANAEHLMGSVGKDYNRKLTSTHTYDPGFHSRGVQGGFGPMISYQSILQDENQDLKERKENPKVRHSAGLLSLPHKSYFENQKGELPSCLVDYDNKDQELDERGETAGSSARPEHLIGSSGKDYKLGRSVKTAGGKMKAKLPVYIQHKYGRVKLVQERREMSPKAVVIQKQVIDPGSCGTMLLNKTRTTEVSADDLEKNQEMEDKTCGGMEAEPLDPTAREETTGDKHNTDVVRCSSSPLPSLPDLRFFKRKSSDSAYWSFSGWKLELGRELSESAQSEATPDISCEILENTEESPASCSPLVHQGFVEYFTETEKDRHQMFTPFTTDDFDDETYRFQCSHPGLYQCTVTGLVFHMEGEGEVLYRTVTWNKRQLSQHHKKPAGPLFDIRCQQMTMSQLHLPHCEILSTGGGAFLSVAHMNDEGIEFIKPHKITESHVIINITGFSAFGNIKDEDSPIEPIEALVLLFYKPPDEGYPNRSSLSVLLVPRNIVIRDIQRTRRKLSGPERYIDVSPHCKLKPKQVYILSTMPESLSVKVQPTEAEFDGEIHSSYFPSFQVILRASIDDINLSLTEKSSSSCVWESEVCLLPSTPRTLNDLSCEKLLKIQSSFMDGVSGPVLQNLLDKLMDEKVMCDSEREVAEEMRHRRDKARYVIDTVRKKGEAASSKMIKFLCEVDSYFSRHLGLNPQGLEQ